MYSIHAAMFYQRLGFYRAKIGENEAKAWTQALKTYNAMLLCHHGMLVCGRNAPEAFVRLHLLQKACEEQLACQNSGAEYFTLDSDLCTAISEQTERRLSDHANTVWGGLISSLGVTFK
jgi:ribulose-5-phosphate 4-epimerase/fuculose-1-phosphate aldolase